MSNIASLITENALSYPHKRALIIPEGRGAIGNRLYGQLTFSQTFEV